MRYTKIKKARNIKFFFILVISSLTLISCGASQDIKKRAQPLNKRRTAAGLKDALKKEDTKTNAVKWNCVGCGYANTTTNNTCTNCGKDKHLSSSGSHASGSKVPHAGMKDGILRGNTSRTKSSDRLEDESCPVCLEDTALSTNGNHTCNQCKKAICGECYMQMRNRNKHFCPLCRFDNASLYRSRSGMHRTRSRTF